MKNDLNNLDLIPNFDNDIEAWIVNTLKIKIIARLDNLLEAKGRENARKLFLVPVFTVAEISRRVEEKAPEMKTYFFKELSCLLEKLAKNQVLL